MLKALCAAPDYGTDYGRLYGTLYFKACYQGAFVWALQADLVEGGSDVAAEEEETSAPHT